MIYISDKQGAGSRPISVMLPAPLSAPSSPEASDLPPRKRQRLTHLSPEEKALRRKLKNRVAAQTARDRKKARMGELELQVVELEIENQKLLLQNGLLREKTQRLSTENQELRQRLGLDALKEEEDEEESKANQSWEDEVRSTQTMCSSAAGAGPEVITPDHLHMDAGSADDSDAESDILLGILDSLDRLHPDMFLYDKDLQSRSLEEEVCSDELNSLPASPSSPLGAPSAKLDAINELIHFDHVYTKPLGSESEDPEFSNPACVVVKMEEATLSPPDGDPSSPLSCVKQEALEDHFIQTLCMESLLTSSEPVLQKPLSLLDTASDSGYEGSPSPFSDLSSPLDSDPSWEDTFANELFPQLISV
ncbi:X-box-binding protein 1 isoform X2 [Ambystoma mexicanum]|uniref:X-box-binding protein 1 isoform X2 n=1 Tax=Ambystoma mexicanum TaxID=8296 RepID=UPI0037E949E9